MRSSLDLKEPMTKIAAGKDIDYFCTRCKLELAHVIIAVVNHLPVRVKCNTCHTERNWRRSGTKKAKAGAKRKTSNSTATKKAAAAMLSAIEKQAQWKTLMEAANAGSADRTPYSIRSVFKDGQIISHKKFGDGIVFDILDDGKIKVCFVDGERLLVHDRG